MLQFDLTAVSVWCKNNFLILNIKKCQAMSFNRSTSSILYSYNIDSIQLSRVNCMIDFGFILDPKLAFNFHVDYVISKSLSMLGFIQRISSEFTDPSTVLCLHSFLVHPHLEYCLVIWYPIYVSNCFRIENLQKKFTRFPFFELL